MGVRVNLLVFRYDTTHRQRQFYWRDIWINSVCCFLFDFDDFGEIKKQKAHELIDVISVDTK